MWQRKCTHSLCSVEVYTYYNRLKGKNVIFAVKKNVKNATLMCTTYFKRCRKKRAAAIIVMWFRVIYEQKKPIKIEILAAYFP